MLPSQCRHDELGMFTVVINMKSLVQLCRAIFLKKRHEKERYVLHIYEIKIMSN